MISYSTVIDCEVDTYVINLFKFTDSTHYIVCIAHKVPNTSVLCIVQRQLLKCQDIITNKSLKT